MERDEVLSVLRDKAVELLGVDPEAITEQASFVRDLDIDSLDLVEYTMAVEDEFSITLPDEELTDLANIGDMVTLVLAKKAAA
ncbi:MAG: acyl carrier protein [Actinomycetota bacterium]|nr:acyl carrier protein [Actinomycetota bacterium]